MRITVNGRSLVSTGTRRRTHEELVKLAIGNPVPGATYTVTCQWRDRRGPNGRSLTPGGSIGVVNGMIINVAQT